MKIRPILLALAASLTAVYAADKPAIWPMPATLPEVPAGANTAAFPTPKIPWLSRVKANNDKAAQTAGSIQLVFDGDSITDGWQTGGKQVWDAHYAKLNAFDFGISGDQTQHVLWRLSQGQVNGIHPKLIAIMIGTNNLGGNTPAEIADGVKAIVEDYRARCPDASILLQGIFPRGHDATDPARAKIKEINKIIAGLADGNKVIFLDFGDKFLEPDGTLSPQIMPDFLHPNAKGYEIWAEAIQPVIDRFFPPSK